VDLGDLSVDLGDLSVDLGDLSVDLGDLSVDLGELIKKMRSILVWQLHLLRLIFPHTTGKHDPHPYSVSSG
jgi:hypothetical protein